MFGIKKKPIDETGIDDDFNLDDDFDMDGFDFQASPVKDDRKPITKVKDAAIDGFKSGITDTGLLKRTLVAALPKQYEAPVSTLENVTDTVKQTVDDVTKEIRPAVKDVKRLMVKTIPTDSKYMPAPVSDMLKRWKEEQEEDSKSSILGKEDQRNQFLAMQMADIFKAQEAEKQSERKEELSRDAADTAMEIEKHRDNVTLLSQIEARVGSIESMQKSSGIAYQKKSLEIGFRQLFAIQDLLEVTQKQSAMILSELPAIRKNTALPEFVKQTNAEFLAEYKKQMFSKTIGDKLFGDMNNMLSNVLENARKNIIEKVKRGTAEFREGLSSAEMGYDMAKDSGMDKYDLAGNVIGGHAATTLMGKMGQGLGKFMGKNEAVGRLGFKLADMNSNAAGHLNEWRLRNANSYDDSIWGKVKSFLATSMTGPETEQSTGAVEFTDVDKPYHFTRKTDRSINEIIPGYLARILREIHVFRTGNESAELVEFDHGKGEFSTTSAVTKTMKDKLFNKTSKQGTSDKLEKLVNSIDKEGQLTAEQRETLKKGLAQNAAKRRTASDKNLGSSYAYEGEHAETVAKFMSDFYKTATPQKKYDISSQHASVLSDIDNPIETIRKYVELGQIDKLKSLGIVGDDNRSISSTDILSMYLADLPKPGQSTGMQDENFAVPKNWDERDGIHPNAFIGPMPKKESVLEKMDSKTGLSITGTISKGKETLLGKVSDAAKKAGATNLASAITSDNTASRQDELEANGSTILAGLNKGLTAIAEAAEAVVDGKVTGETIKKSVQSKIDAMSKKKDKVVSDIRATNAEGKITAGGVISTGVKQAKEAAQSIADSGIGNVASEAASTAANAVQNSTVGKLASAAVADVKDTKQYRRAQRRAVVAKGRANQKLKKALDANPNIQKKYAEVTARIKNNYSEFLTEDGEIDSKKVDDFLISQKKTMQRKAKAKIETLHKLFKEKKTIEELPAEVPVSQPDGTVEVQDQTEPKKKFAAGGVFRKRNAILKKSHKFKMQSGEKMVDAVAGEAGEEAIMPLKNEHVNVVDETGNDVGQVPVARNKKGILSVMMDQFNKAKDLAKESYAQIEKDGLSGTAEKVKQGATQAIDSASTKVSDYAKSEDRSKKLIDKIEKISTMVKGYLPEKETVEAAKASAASRLEQFKSKAKAIGEKGQEAMVHIGSSSMFTPKAQDEIIKQLKKINATLEDIRKGGGISAKKKFSLWPFGRKDKTEEPKPTYGKGISGLVGRTAAGVTGMLGKVAGGAFKVTRAANNASFRNLGRIANAGKGLMKKAPSDIYVQGDKDGLPRLYAKDLKAEMYSNRTSGKPVIYVDDIRDDVVDEDGNVVITKAEIKKTYSVKKQGVVSKLVKGGAGLVGSAFGMIPGILKKQGDILTSALGVTGSLIGGAKDLAMKAVGLLDSPCDVYCKDDLTEPVLYKSKMRKGQYRNKETGDVIWKPSEIEGAVIDEEGQVVVTFEQYKMGLVDVRGRKLSTGLVKLLKSPFGAAKLAFGVGRKINNTLWGMTKKSLSGLKSLGGKLIDKMTDGSGFSGFTFDIGSNTTRPILEEIRDILKERLPQTNKSTFGDQDGDGDKENSWQDLKAKSAEKNKALRERIEATKQNAKDKLSNWKSGMKSKGDGLLGKLGGLFSLPGKMLGMMKGILSVPGKIGSLVKGVGGLLSLGKGAGGMVGKLVGLLTKIPGIGAIGSAMTGLAGMLGFGGSAAAATTTAVATGGVVAAEAGAAAAAGTALTAGAAGTAAAGAAAGGGVLATIGGGLAAAASGIAAFVSSPVVLGAAAVALVGYAGYKTYQYFNEKPKAHDNIRFVQYGSPGPLEMDYMMLRGLEEIVTKHTKITNEGATIDESKIEVGTFLKTVKMESTKENMIAFFKWYQERFKPVYLTHVTALNAIDKSTDLSDVKSISKKDLKKYIQAVAFPEGPYTLALPFGSMKNATSSDVKKAVDIALAELKDKKETVGDKISDGAKSLGSGISTAASATVNAVKQGPQGITDLGAKAVGSVKSGADTLVDKIQQTGADLKKMASPVTNTVSGIYNKVKDAASTYWKSFESSWPQLAQFLRGGAVNVGMLLKFLAKSALVPVKAVASAGSWLGGLATRAYRGVFGYKLEGIDKLRYVQYGFQPNDKSNFDKIMKLEEYLSKFVTINGQEISIDEEKMDIKESMDAFGMDAGEVEDLKMFFSWYQKRFKPVFLKHIAVAKKLGVSGEPVLHQLGKLNQEQLATYIKNAEYLDGPYNEVVLPVKGKYSVTGLKDVKSIIDVLKKELNLGKVKAKDLSVATPALQVADEEAARNSESGLTQSNQKESKKDFKLPAAAKQEEGEEVDLPDEQTLQALIKLSNLKQVGKYSALEAVRFKAYGLTTLDQQKLKVIKQLEQQISKEVVFANGVANWSGSAIAVFEKNKGAFGVVDSQGPNYNNWLTWFLKRFLPVFLQHVAMYCAYSGRKNVDENLGVLKVSQQYDIAKTIAGLACWKINNSPWPNYILGVDPAITKENLQFLMDTVAQEKALEDKKKVSQQTGSPSSPTQPQKQGPNIKPDQTGNSGIGSPDLESKQTGSGSGGGATATDLGGASPNGLKLADGPVLDGRNGYGAITKKDQSVNLSGVNPQFLTQFLGAAEEYHQITGKKIQINDGFRSYEEQVEMKKKYGARAATPGHSLHGFGLAIDANSADMDAMEKLGLTRKYGLTRPVGGEPWHVEPIGIQFNIDSYKQNREAASAASADGMGRGGGGLGTVPNAPKYTRNIELSKKIANASIKPNVEIKGTKANLKQQDVAALPASLTNSDSGVNKTPNPAVPTSRTGKSALDRAPQQTGMPDQEVKQPGKSGATASPRETGPSGMADASKPSMPANPATKVQKPNPNDKRSVQQTVVQAAKLVGVNPDNALSTVAIESGFNPSAKSNASSATGLYQFTDDSWKDVTRDHGASYGINFASPRTDAVTNAIMGAHFIKDNEKRLRGKGITPGPTELYATHFIGPYGGPNFLKVKQQNPNTPVASVVDARQVRSNPDILGGGKTVGQSYAIMQDKVQNRAKDFGITLSGSTGTSGGYSMDTIDGPQSGSGSSPSPQPTQTAAANAPQKRLNAYGEAFDELPKTQYYPKDPESVKAPSAATTLREETKQITSPIEGGSGFNPDYMGVDQTVRQNQTGVSFMKRTEDLLGTSVKTQVSMLKVLEGILGSMKNGESLVKKAADDASKQAEAITKQEVVQEQTSQGDVKPKEEKKDSLLDGFMKQAEKQAKGLINNKIEKFSKLPVSMRRGIV